MSFRKFSFINESSIDILLNFKWSARLRTVSNCGTSESKLVANLMKSFVLLLRNFKRTQVVHRDKSTEERTFAAHVWISTPIEI